MLSRDDIKNSIIKGELEIYPLNPQNLTGIGYNISTTHFAFSTNKGILLTIYKKTTAHGAESFVSIPPNDTVLFFSKEYISVNEQTAGAFFSKVSLVCKGLGHISTTLDPTWKGQLIISINNPTNKTIDFNLDKEGNISTLLLYKLDTPVSGPNIHDNNQGRCDLLLEHFCIHFKNHHYRMKHLELKSFILNEFSNSLNGEDCFTMDTQKNDKYSKKLCNLISLQNRLKSDKELMLQQRYDLGLNGSNGIYRLLRNIEEEKLISSCSIFPFSLFKTSRGDLEHQMSFPSYHIQDTRDLQSPLFFNIDVLLQIIRYEISTIDHKRRISWQNSTIDKFAGEESDLVKEQNKLQKHSLIKNILLFLFLTILFVIFLILGINLGLHYLSIEKDSLATSITLVAAYITLVSVLVPLWVKSLTTKIQDYKDTFLKQEPKM